MNRPISATNAYDTPDEIRASGWTHLVYTEVRFTGGPLYWRRSTGPAYRLLVANHVDEIELPGLVRAPRRATERRPTYRIGWYRRVEPDRFRWMGWRS